MLLVGLLIAIKNALERAKGNRIKYMIYDNETLRQLITKYKSREQVPLICSSCERTFTKQKNEIQWVLKRKPTSVITCSPACGSRLNRVDRITKFCVNCSISIVRKASEEVGNSFCSSKCSATYSNTHKTTGTRRSKLETWLEQQLISLYPNLAFQFNMKDTIQSELDIYIPTLKLAFELNGIFHYEPIYGVEKLASILNNDTRKFQACLEHGIELCIIDSSKQKYFTEKSSQQFLTIIETIISQKLLAMQRVSDSNG
jgi:hypothetical protein